jgi:hypothetical protein
MIDETRQVLEMLAAGTITPDQAAELLDAMDDREPQPTPVHARPRGERQRERGRRRGERNREHRSHRAIRDSALAELAEARLMGVTPEYIRDLQEAGFAIQNLKELTELRTHGVDAEFIEEMRNLGFTDLDTGELIELKISGVDEDFLREMHELGYLSPTVAQAVGFRDAERERVEVEREDAEAAEEELR